MISIRKTRGSHFTFDIVVNGAHWGLLDKVPVRKTHPHPHIKQTVVVYVPDIGVFKCASMHAARKLIANMTAKRNPIETIQSQEL